MKITDPRKRLSKEVFNSLHRLDVAAVLLHAGDEQVDRAMVSDRAAIPPTAAHKELHHLAEIGALEVIEDRRYISFARLEHTFWGFARELIARADASEPSRRGASTDPP